jgi:hypothetical protein
LIQGQYLQIGSLQCKLTSERSRYADMLADAYGTSLVNMQGSGKLDQEIELDIHIRENPILRENLSDTLTVTPTMNGYRIDTDPICCRLTRLGESKARAEIEICQPAMDSTPLGYHLWLVTNRMLLLLDALLIHTAAVNLHGNVNLFCGHKGAGKSTLSVFLAKMGATILSEDHVVLRRKKNIYQVSGCTSRIRIMADTEDFLLPNQLNHDAIPIGDVPKKEFPAGQFFAALPHKEHSPKRLFLNQVGHSFGVRPLSAKEALLLMVDRTANMYRFDDQKDYASFFGFLAGFVHQIDCFSLDLSPNLSELPRVLDMLNDLDGKTGDGKKR